MVVSSDAETLDPRFVTDATGLRISRLVHAGLMRLDPDTGAPVPYLARGVTTSPDGLTVTLQLREDVYFHSVAPLTARDVVATIHALRDPRLASRHARVLGAIAGALDTDPHTVVVTLSRPHATTLTDLEVPVLRADQVYDAPDLGGTLDGLGPYRVVTRARGSVELAPADRGALPRPAHAVRVRSLRDENARALRLLTGSSDVAINALSPALLPSLEAQGLRVASRPGLSVNYVVMRLDRGPFASLAARQALDASIDRESIVKHLLSGRAQIARGLLSPSHWAAAGGEPPAAFDLARARALLGGAHLRATLLCGTDRLRVDVARSIAQDAAGAGLDLEIVPLELGALLARLAAGDFDAATLQLPELVEPNTLRVFLHSTSIPPQGSNRGRVRDQALDELLDDGEATGDRSRRAAIYAKLEARIRQQAFVLPLWHEDQIAVTGPRAAGFQTSAEGRWLGLAALP